MDLPGKLNELREMSNVTKCQISWNVSWSPNSSYLHLDFYCHTRSSFSFDQPPTSAGSTRPLYSWPIVSHSSLTTTCPTLEVETLQKVQMLCYYECRGWLLLLNIHPEAAEIHFWGPCRCSRWLLWPLCCRLLAPLKSSNQQRHPEAVFEICVATCISDVVFITGSSLPTTTSITTC